MKRAIAAAFLLATGCASPAPEPSSPPTPAASASPVAASQSPLRLNQIQVLGTHNSYEQPVDPRLLAYADPIVSGMMAQMTANLPAKDKAQLDEEHPAGLSMAQGLAYNHPPLKDQLDAGLRSLEIDIFNDPDGGLFLDPAGYRWLRKQGVPGPQLPPHDTTDLDKPDFKVLHIPDLDFRSHCPTLRRCLRQIRAWSDAHPRHTPLFILLEIKTNAIPIFPGATRIRQFDAAAFDALDAELVQEIGRDRIVAPDDVRGGAATLEEAVLAGKWPTLEASRGKIVFLMLTAVEQSATKAYLDGHASLAGRMAFVRSAPGQPHAAFLLLDNALVRGAEISERVRQGYLVRTRTDIETKEARTGDTTRAKAAFASGAQVVSTDFFRPGNAFGTSYFVTLPGGGDYRCNPVAVDRCR